MLPGMRPALALPPEHLPADDVGTHRHRGTGRDVTARCRASQRCGLCRLACPENGPWAPKSVPPCPSAASHRFTGR